MSVKAVIEQAMQLSPEEREQVIEILRAANAEEAPVDPEWEAAWTAEIQRRVADIREGRVETIDGEEVMAEMRAIAARHAIAR